MRVFLNLLIIMLLAGLCQSQTVEPAPEDKSIVYFMRPNSTGFLINFTFYDGVKMIAKFNGEKYFRYECEPGEHTFWARSENRSYMKATLNAGKIYLVEAVPSMGAFKASVRLQPISAKIDNMKRFQRLLIQRPSESFTEQEIEKWTANSSGYGTMRGLQRLRDLELKNHQFISLLSECYIEPEEWILQKKVKKKKVKKKKSTKRTKKPLR